MINLRAPPLCRGALLLKASSPGKEAAEVKGLILLCVTSSLPASSLLLLNLLLHTFLVRRVLNDRYQRSACIHPLSKHSLICLLSPGRLTLSKVNTIMCSLGSASWLLGSHVCSVIGACQAGPVKDCVCEGLNPEMMLPLQLSNQISPEYLSPSLCCRWRSAKTTIT